MSDFMDNVVAQVEAHGHVVISIGSDKDTGAMPYCYTVGLTPIARCELILEGVPPARALTILNAIARVVKAKGKLEPMVMIGALQDDFPLGIIPTNLSARSGRLSIAESLFPDIDNGIVFQVALPDAERRLPWDDGYSLTGLNLMVTDPNSEATLERFRELPVEHVEAIIRSPESLQPLS